MTANKKFLEKPQELAGSSGPALIVRWGTVVGNDPSRTSLHALENGSAPSSVLSYHCMIYGFVWLGPKGDRSAPKRPFQESASTCVPRDLQTDSFWSVGFAGFIYFKGRDALPS